VDDVSLRVGEGERFGLLGPNGSGKTTLVRMLLGLVFATGGEITVLGHRVPRHVHKALPDIGALIEEPAAYPHLSGRSNLRLLDASGPRSDRRTRRRRVDEALERVGLGGIDPPRLLVLDEPGNGLDPRGIRDIRDLLLELNDAGVTVFLSSHQLHEVSLLCTHIGVLDRGRLVLSGSLAELQAPTGRVVVNTEDAERAVALLDGHVERREGDRLVVRHPDPASLNAELVGGGVRVASIATEQRSLEEVVLSVTSAGSDEVKGGSGAGEKP
jgi:ABC-2 type transport system ATP-binding protein